MLSPLSGILAHSLIWKKHSPVFSFGLTFSVCVSIELDVSHPVWRVHAEPACSPAFVPACGSTGCVGFLGCAGVPPSRWVVELGAECRRRSPGPVVVSVLSGVSLEGGPGDHGAGAEALRVLGFSPADRQALLACPGVRAWACASNLALLSPRRCCTRAWRPLWFRPEQAHVWAGGGGGSRVRTEGRRGSPPGGQSQRLCFIAPSTLEVGSKPVRVLCKRRVASDGSPMTPWLSNPPRGPSPWGPTSGLGVS